MKARSHRQRWASLAVPAVIAACVWPMPASAAGAPLIGTFRLQPGACSGAAVTGSYLRMVLPDGTASGPYLSNSDSTCSDQSYTPLRPGNDGGVVTGGYQSMPAPAFDSSGNALATRITQPASFYGTGFATATNSVDPQTKAAVPAPVIIANGRALTADLRSFSVQWNDQHFNQGSPKPGGGYPGSTRAAKGTYDPATGAFTLQWTSQVVGGPFDKFTGLWHLQGTFVPAYGGAGRAGGGSVDDSSGRPSAGPSAAPGSVPAARPGGTAAAPRPPQGGLPSAQPNGPASAAALPSLPSVAPTSGGDAQAPTLAGAQPLATTSTTTSDSWSVRGWLVALAAVIALFGFTALGVLQRRLAVAGRPRVTPEDQP
jgi:hypothetical protein